MASEVRHVAMLVGNKTCPRGRGHATLQSLCIASHPIANLAPQVESRSGRSLELALAAARTAEENRGTEVAVLDMRKITPEFDYFVIATGNSRRQLHAISEEIDRTLEQEMGDHRMGLEGYNDSRWILLDYGNVVIHLFDEETREYYALEEFWGDAVPVALPWRTGEAPQALGGSGE